MGSIFNNSPQLFANYEVRSDYMTVAWFIIEEDAEAFIRGLDVPDPTRYSVVEVNKRVVEDN